MLDPTIIEIANRKQTGAGRIVLSVVLFVLGAVAFKKALDYKKSIMSKATEQVT